MLRKGVAMCGIAGVWQNSNKIKKEIIQNMISVLRHRGPDAQGILFFNNDTVAFSHGRLSILDLSAAGNQPMVDDSSGIALIYNGELYNYKQLREELVQNGYTFYTQTDTEVVLKSYIHWGKECFKKFNGMFAIAFWNPIREELVLARDQFGIKPLYYYADPYAFVFASEIKAILAYGDIQKSMNWQGLSEYLWFGNALDNNTLFNKIYKLLPGHVLTLCNNNITQEVYWHPEKIIPTSDNFQEAMLKVRDKLEKAVVSHLQSDVPVGIFLSGGIDSTTITAFASKYLNKVNTYSVGFGDNKFNELAKASFVAKYYSTHHHELTIYTNNLPDVLMQLVKQHDEPFADAANIPLYLLSKQLAGNKVKVVLQGDGGDEIFAGYNRYILMGREKLLHILAKIVNLSGSINNARWSKLINAMAQPTSAKRMSLLTSQINTKLKLDMFLSREAGEMLKQHNPFIAYEKYAQLFSDLPAAQRMLYTDCCTELPNTFLEKVDKATMAASIEARVPFLDKDLSEYVMSLPWQYKVKNGQKKFILRQAIQGIVPDFILDAPKTGFGVPLDKWLRDSILLDFAKSLLLSEAASKKKLFNQKTLAIMLDDHINARANYGFILWKLMHILIWIDTYQINVGL